MALKTPQTLADRFDQRLFDAIYSRALVYNTCWEDPAVDRLALDIKSDDTMLVITSAGCNVIDYALTGPRRIHAVDANPRQNALLELKLAGIRHLSFEDFFAAFGRGYHPELRSLYAADLRTDLSPFAQRFWDKRIEWFGNPCGSFYYHGLSGIVARTFRTYLRVRPRLAASINELFDTRTLDDQWHVYDTCVRPLMWTAGVNWTVPKVRSIFLSDIHLGTRACQAKRLLEFLREYESDNLFLVGDIVDFWAMKRGVFWSTSHNTVGKSVPEIRPPFPDPVQTPAAAREAE